MLAFLSIYLILSLLIFSHELVRLCVARKFGFQIPAFGLGQPIGPFLTIWKKHDFELRIYLFLFGAHVFIPELDPENSQEKNARQWPSRQFLHFPTWQKLTVILAGVSFYIVFAWLLLFVSSIVSGAPKTDVIVQGLSSSNRLAANAGIKSGDYIIAINDQEISSPHAAADLIHANTGNPIKIQIRRQEKVMDIPVTVDSSGKLGLLLVGSQNSIYQKTTLFDSFGLATQSLIQITKSLFEYLAVSFCNKYNAQPNGDPNEYKTHGLLAIIAVGADIAVHDLRRLPFFLAVFFINMGLINFVPWPGFDGNYLLQILIDGIRQNFMKRKSSA